MRGYSSPFFSIYSDIICNALFKLQPFLHIIFIPFHLLNGTDHFHLKSIIPLKKIITSCLMVSEAGLLLDRTTLLRYNILKISKGEFYEFRKIYEPCRCITYFGQRGSWNLHINQRTGDCI